MKRRIFGADRVCFSLPASALQADTLLSDSTTKLRAHAACELPSGRGAPHAGSGAAKRAHRTRTRNIDAANRARRFAAGTRHCNRPSHRLDTRASHPLRRHSFGGRAGAALRCLCAAIGRGALREVLADYAVPETTGGFYAEIPFFHVALNDPTTAQCRGSGTMTREVGCSR